LSDLLFFLWMGNLMIKKIASCGKLCPFINFLRAIWFLNDIFCFCLDFASHTCGFRGNKLIEVDSKEMTLNPVPPTYNFFKFRRLNFLASQSTISIYLSTVSKIYLFFLQDRKTTSIWSLFEKKKIKNEIILLTLKFETKIYFTFRLISKKFVELDNFIPQNLCLQLANFWTKIPSLFPL
jgi:hypothetical protein